MIRPINNASTTEISPVQPLVTLEMNARPSVQFQNQSDFMLIADSINQNNCLEIVIGATGRNNDNPFTHNASGRRTCVEMFIMNA